MSLKNRDNKNRWRNKTVAFRVSPEEDAQIETAVRLSGLTKQDYITRRLLCREVVVQGNPRVYKALRNELAAVLAELQRIEAGGGVDGQVLVIHDMLGINKGFSPRFLRRYADLHEVMTGAVTSYVEDVKSGDFPNESEQY